MKTERLRQTKQKQEKQNEITKTQHALITNCWILFKHTAGSVSENSLIPLSFHVLLIHVLTLFLNVGTRLGVFKTHNTIF